jgi:integrase
MKIPNKLVILLDNELKRQKQYKNFKNEWYVIGAIEPIATTTLDNRFKRYIKESKVKPIRIHDLRHSHASLLISKGADITIVAEKLRRKTNKTKKKELPVYKEKKPVKITNHQNPTTGVVWMGDPKWKEFNIC